MKSVNYLVGSPDTINTPLVPFSPLIKEFVAAFSAKLLKSPKAKQFPDIVALGFWCRKSNIEKLQARQSLGNDRVGRGLVFHVAPSNVPVNFAFSYFFALLAGNANIVRVPSKEFPQVEIICDVLKSVLSDYPEIDKRTAFVKYPVSDEITGEFCRLADARIIWGGDETVRQLRTYEVKPRCVDVVFADRYSLAVVDAATVEAASEAEMKKLCDGFYNDTYLMDQNACSSAQLILWQNAAEGAKDKFWEAVARSAGKYNLQAAVAVDKYCKMCEDAIDLECVASVKRYGGNLVYVAELNKLPEDTSVLRGKGGYFYQFDIDGFSDIDRIVNERYQTVSCFGVSAEELREHVISSGLRGIDRIVPFGSAMDISVIWDGFDIIGTLSRIVALS
ncbi:MAG: hypothetical protein LBL82_01825 [Oscillospiraceae bacterium]|jgi:hypothetical protein|nr:hypothetical protein [Oscillospiraceae bacterium]